MTKTTTTETSTKTPAEIDTILATNWEAQASLTTVIERSRRTVADKTTVGYYVEQAQQRIDECSAALARLVAEAAPYEAEFAGRGGWTRYFIVRNSNGHVHRERSCSTCFATTDFGWLPNLSGCDESAMVAEYGELACTVCFPDAPTMTGFGDGTSALARFGQAERDERAAAKAERAAAKAAKRLDETVRFQHGGYTERIETIAAAKTWIKNAIDNRIRFGYHTFDTAETFAAIDTLVAALVARDVDAPALVAKWTAAAEKYAA